METMLAKIVTFALMAVVVLASHGPHCETDAQCAVIGHDLKCVDTPDNVKRCIQCSCLKTDQCRVSCINEVWNVSCDCSNDANTVQPICEPTCQHSPSPCGSNTMCADAYGTSAAICTCLPGYVGDPYSPEGCLDCDNPYTCNCGTCITTGGISQCSCHVEWAGPYCKTDLVCPGNSPSPPYQTVSLQDGTVITYRIGTEFVTQPVAKAICCSEGARLLRILSDEKMIIMLNAIFGPPYDIFWVDGSNVDAIDKSDRTQWTSFCGEPLPDTPITWFGYNPTCQTCNCITLYGGGLAWLNWVCNGNLFRYVCEKV